MIKNRNKFFTFFLLSSVAGLLLLAASSRILRLGAAAVGGGKPERWTGFRWVDSEDFKKLQGGYLQAIKDGEKKSALENLSKLIDKMPEDNSVRVDFYLPAKFRLQAELGKSKLEQLKTVVEYVDRVFAYAKRPGYKKLSHKSLLKTKELLLPIAEKLLKSGKKIDWFAIKVLFNKILKEIDGKKFKDISYKTGRYSGDEWSVEKIGKEMRKFLEKIEKEPYLEIGYFRNLYNNFVERFRAIWNWLLKK